MKAVSLHHHSTFSFGDGFGTPPSHVERAAELGYSAMALTEHGNVSSHFQFEKAALKAGIKPIFGLEAYCGAVTETDRSAWKNHLTILAADAEGYRNLNRMVERSYIDFYYHPTVSGQNLVEHSDGIVVLSGCSGSLLACTLLGGKGIPDKETPDIRAAIEVALKFKAIFGDRYFIEVQPFYELPRTVALNTSYAKISKKTGIPLVVTFDVHYPRMKDSEMQAVLHAVHRGKASVDDQLREWNYEVPLTLPDDETKIQRRLARTGLNDRQAWKAIENTIIVADMCNVTLPKAEPLRYPADERDLEPWTTTR